MPNSKMSSSPSLTLTLVCCFLAFLLGQVFNSFCVRISSHMLVVEKVVVVYAGYSLKMLVLIVLCVLGVNNIGLLLAYRYLLRTPAKAAEHRRVIISPWITESDAIHVPRRTPLLLLGSVVPTGFLNGRINIPAELPTFIRVFRKLTALGFKFDGRVIRGTLRITIHTDEDENQTRPLFLESASSKTIERNENPQPVHTTRLSRANVLQHVAAAALLRKLQFYVVEEECCYASVEELEEKEEQILGHVERSHKDQMIKTEDDQIIEDVEETSDTCVDAISSLEEPQTKVEDPEHEENVQEDTIDIEGVVENQDVEIERHCEDAKQETSDTAPVVEQVEIEQHTEDGNEKTGTDATHIDAMPSEEEKRVGAERVKNIDEEVEETATFADALSSVEKKAAKIEVGQMIEHEDEKNEAPFPVCDDTEDLLSYEEFAAGVPSDILFMKKSVDSLYGLYSLILLMQATAALSSHRAHQSQDPHVWREFAGLAYVLARSTRFADIRVRVRVKRQHTQPGSVPMLSLANETK
ncbi:hypothetical protein C8F04DRAFT_1260152 [Mycena alexandri]|uniref:Uncharacterized protein n=1 Tax=Mycena alexandri TaxID=1745969 RepID=A0AAD6SW45_9AGAR|nr:hypothetical protein C8F04DRAFT_1260152 [Mycena alexandri]